MELGYDGVLLNSAVALAQEPIKMAKAFRYAVEAGRLGFEAGAMQKRDMATPSTPTVRYTLLASNLMLYRSALLKTSSILSTGSIFRWLLTSSGISSKSLL